ncbi:hypothetical protein Btru_066891 [Bulinus truncatus]|nr:hypothetical protein Btru_066891 [Bulinus truncatus]
MGPQEVRARPEARHVFKARRFRGSRRNPAEIKTSTLVPKKMGRITILNGCAGFRASRPLVCLPSAHKSTGNSRRRTRRQPSTRARSQSPGKRKLADINLDDTIDPRPPFVVRKLTEDLIGRTPGAVTDKTAKSKPKRSSSPYRSVSQSQLDFDLNDSSVSKPNYRLSKVIREPYEDPLPVFKPSYSSKLDEDTDHEVEELTSTKASYFSQRPRSVSPILYRSSFRERYGDSFTRPHTPSYYERLAEWELERARARRLSRLYNSYYSSLDDLDLELRLARIRAGRYF